MLDITVALALVALSTVGPVAPPAASDTIRLEVGSPEVDARYFVPHAARVRVRQGAADGPIIQEWVNELTVGDSAGRAVHRWVTRGTRITPQGPVPTWELRQTFDARTLALLGYERVAATGGAFTRFAIRDGRMVGSRRTPTDTAVQKIDAPLPRLGFMAAASDLVPLAVGFKAGKVMTAPVWGPEMQQPDLRIFSVLGQKNVNVEGTNVLAWEVEERRYADKSLVATWYLIEKSPYMVYGTVVRPNGTVDHMSEVAVEMGRK